jgi:methionyl-tRNA formyltransferase
MLDYYTPQSVLFKSEDIMARIVFLGTPDFAVPSLDALADHPDFELVGVVTQPDRPAGRGRTMRQSPVKERAVMLGLPVFQPESLRKQEAVDHLAAWQPDVLVVAAFGQILRLPVLELAPHGCLNVHASLLPRWRGAAPIQYAIRAGDDETGVTIMKVDEGLDTGPMLAWRAIPIAPDETGASLHDKLAALGAELLPPTLAGYLAGEIVPQPQPEEGVTLAPSLKKSAGEIDWAQRAVEIDRQVRAYTPWPGTSTSFDGTLLKVIVGAPLPSPDKNAPPGTLLAEGEGLAVQTGEGLYRLDVIQPAGKKEMSSQAFLAGRPEAVGMRLGG